jgi:hypothetical protein
MNLIHMKKAWWREDADGMVRLSHSLLRQVIPRQHLKPVRDTLVKAGRILWDKTYDKGRSQRYGIPDKYSKTRRVVCPDDKLNRKIATLYATEERTLLPVHRWLWDNLARMTVDLGQARAVIATLRPKTRKRKARYTTAEHRQKLGDQVALLANGDFRLTRDNYGRVHTPITRLPRELRCCLRVNGAPLVNIDLANSQPWVLGVVALQAVTGTRWSAKRLAAMAFTDRNPYNATHQRMPTATGASPTPQPTIPSTQPSSISTPVLIGLAHSNPASGKGLERRGAAPLPADLTEWMRQCAAGTLYESLMTSEELAKGERFRARFKVRLYRVLFGRNETGLTRFRSVIRGRLRGRYPTVAKVLFELKRRNYKHSSHVLQNFEATLFIHRVAGRIMRERPGCFLATIHDSFLTTPDNEGYVRVVTCEELAKVAPPPPLRAERYA